MSIAIDDIRRVLVRELDGFAREVEMLPDDEGLWKTVPGISNSVGTLATHVCGNLKHFIGGILGGSGYVRDREAEFSSGSRSREEVIREVRETAEIVSGALQRVPEASLGDEYPEAVAGVELPTGRALLHLCTHLAFHLGQAGYLRRVITGEARGSGALSVRALSAD
jgi:uncharacterized damage-inducible protein DinB